MEEFGFNLVALILFIIGVPLDGFVLKTKTVILKKQLNNTFFNNWLQLKRIAWINNILRLILLLALFLQFFLGNNEDTPHLRDIFISYLAFTLIALIIIVYALYYSENTRAK